MLLEGIFAPITTPFYPDERLYFKKLESNVTRLSLTALSGLVVLGSTGEAVALDDAETREVLRAAAAAAEDKVLIAGIGRESVKATVALAEFAAEHKLRRGAGAQSELLSPAAQRCSAAALLPLGGRPVAAAGDSLLDSRSLRSLRFPSKWLRNSASTRILLG
jgi:hypothetical protein